MLFLLDLLVRNLGFGRGKKKINLLDQEAWKIMEKGEGDVKNI